MSDEKKGKGGKAVKILLIVFIIAAVGVGGFFGAMYFIKSKAPTGNVPAQTKQAAVAEKTVGMEDFIVNLADTDTKAYLKTKIFIAYPDKNKDLDKEITDKTPEIRDIVNTTLRKKTVKDFNGDGLEKVRKELIGRINSILANGQITNIYFNEIITQ